VDELVRYCAGGRHVGQLSGAIPQAWKEDLFHDRVGFRASIRRVLGRSGLSFPDRDEHASDASVPRESLCGAPSSVSLPARATRNTQPSTI